MPQNSQFFPESEPKGPQGPIWTPQDDKNCFFELPGYENPMLEKIFFELSPIEKSWCDLTMAPILFPLFFGYMTLQMAPLAKICNKNFANFHK